MSHEDHKLKHSKRIHDTETKIKKQVSIAKGYHVDSKWKYIDQPHRNHKKHILNCGDPKCHMCMNPRKSEGERTIQEKSFDQVKLQDFEINFEKALD